MPLVQSALRKIGAFIAGGMTFFILWLIVPADAPSVLGFMPLRLGVSVTFCIIITLAFDSAIGTRVMHTVGKKMTEEEGVEYLFQLPGLIILGLFSLVIGTTVLALIDAISDDTRKKEEAKK
jgi:hypothetical protein